MARGALRRLDKLAYGRSPRLVDLPGFEQWQSRTLALDPNFESFFKINFPFFVEKMRFVIFHPKLAQPPPPVSKCVTFRKKLRTYEMLPKAHCRNWQFRRKLLLVKFLQKVDLAQFVKEFCHIVRCTVSFYPLSCFVKVKVASNHVCTGLQLGERKFWSTQCECNFSYFNANRLADMLVWCQKLPSSGGFNLLHGLRFVKKFINDLDCLCLVFTSMWVPPTNDIQSLKRSHQLREMCRE